MVGCGVSWIGGFAASLGRMVTAVYEGRPFRHAYEFVRDGVVSVVIGLAGYWAGMAQGVSPALLALTLLLGGYAGTRTLSVWVDRMLRPTKE
jgi:4-hydroxybenzoate polyprenyltransferase